MALIGLAVFILFLPLSVPLGILGARRKYQHLAVRPCSECGKELGRTAVDEARQELADENRSRMQSARENEDQSFKICRIMRIRCQYCSSVYEHDSMKERRRRPFVTTSITLSRRPNHGATS